MRNPLSAVILSILTLAISVPAFAVPTLQLGIGGGFYDTESQSIATHANTFTLYAYGKATGSKAVKTTDSHFISVAITPKIGPAPTNFGSFTFAGNTYDVGDLVYGNPPLEEHLDHDPGDLSPHGIFNTFFLEVQFFFSGSQKTSLTNTQNSPSYTPVAGSGTDLFFMGFQVDVSNMLQGFDLHFDLYNDKIRSNGDIDVSNFAPFSHDATTIRLYEPVPEPDALTLLLAALAMKGLQRLRAARQV